MVKGGTPYWCLVFARLSWLVFTLQCNLCMCDVLKELFICLVFPPRACVMFNMPVSSRRRVYNLSSGEHLLKCLFFILPRENLTHKWECMHWIKLGSLIIIHSSILFKHDNEKLSEFLFVSMVDFHMQNHILGAKGHFYNALFSDWDTLLIC